MLQIARRDQLRRLTDDYGCALLHVVWYREDRQRFLLFAMVELVPAELPPPDQTKLQSHPVRSRGRQHHLYLRRIPMAVPDALGWYAQALLGTVVVPDGRPDSPRHLAVTSFAQEPVWPYLVATHMLPAVSTAVRAHFALQRTPPPEASYPLGDSSALAWLGRKLTSRGVVENRPCRIGLGPGEAPTQRSPAPARSSAPQAVTGRREVVIAHLR